MKGSRRFAVSRRTSQGFTLIEVLVVIAVIGLLMALLLPAVAAVLESTRRMRCQANLKQMGVAMSSILSTHGVWPSGAMSQPYANDPGMSPQFYRWSALARLLPHVENYSVFEEMNFDVPMYNSFFRLNPENTTAISRSVELFLCPSDRQVTVETNFGSCNYVTSTGSGAFGGSPFDTDGVFFVNSQTRPKDVLDGTANTVVMSESLLGDGPRALTRASLAHPRISYAYSQVAPLSDTFCRSPVFFNYQNLRGFSWANGEYRCTLYNHYYTPNADTFDCIGALIVPPRPEDRDKLYAAYGWRAARSNHPGGVNVLMADGSSDFVTSSIDVEIWRAASTREGKEPGRLP